MRTAVVYYSLEGNIRLAATQLAERLGASVHEVRPVKAYPRKGLAKFLVGGKDSTFGRTPAIEPVDLDLASVDLLVLALPVWAGKAAAPMSSFVEGARLGSTRVALVVASASGNADSCVRDLASKIGRSPSDLATLSLRNPAKMDADELARQLDAFAESLQHSAGGAF